MKTRIGLMAILVATWAGAFAQLVQAPAELKKLDWLLGTWEGKVAWTMPGMSGDSTMTMKSEWDGAFFKSVSTTDMGGMKSVETGYGWYDKDKKLYKFCTFTNFAPTPRFESGTFENDTLTMVSDPWETGMPGPATVARATMVKKSATEATFMLEFKNGDKWDKVAEGKFLKKK